MTSDHLAITYFSPETASEEQWTHLLRLREMFQKEVHPRDPLPDNNYWRSAVVAGSSNPIDVYHHWLVSLPDEPSFVGSVLLMLAKEGSQEYEDRKHTAFARIYVHPDYRRRGFGTKILEWLVKYAREKDISIFQTGSTLSCGKAFAAHFHCKEALNQIENRLYVDDLDVAQLQQWNQAGAERNSMTRIRLYAGRVPNEFMDAYCAVMNAVVPQVPMGELESMVITFTPEVLQKHLDMIEQHGGTMLTALTLENDGSASGVTRMEYNPGKPHEITQDITGVLDSHRGRGLGKWLKAHMMLHVLAQYPALVYVVTGNASVNAPMLSINQRMGFKEYAQFVMYKAAVDDLATQFGV